MTSLQGQYVFVLWVFFKVKFLYKQKSTVVLSSKLIVIRIRCNLYLLIVTALNYLVADCELLQAGRLLLRPFVQQTRT